jgi:lysophospholipid acyltransferase (LPLAT)-like uncharacterized protein
VTKESSNTTQESSEGPSNPAPEPPAANPEEERQTRLPRRIKKAFKRFFVSLAVATLPRIYLTYMWFVYKTSKVEELGFTPAMMREQCGQGIWAIWHDEVFFVAYAFGKYKPHTLASRGDFGELVARLLELCTFTTFRGGSSSSRKRRSSDILRDMIDCMNSEEGVLYGITTDGSKGPLYRMKKGVAKISVACQAPAGVQRTWCKRYVQLPTWDKTFIPMPFNHIVHVFQGPFYPPKGEEGLRVFVKYSLEIEQALCRMSGYARRYIEGGKSLPEQWVELFPKKFHQAIKDETVPELFLPVDPDFYDERSKRSRAPSGPEALDAEGR